MPTQACPVCNSDNLQFFPYRHYPTTSNMTRIKHLAENYWSQARQIFSQKMQHNQRKLFSIRFPIGLCGACGHGAYRQEIKEQELQEYYRSHYWQAGGISQDQWNRPEVFQNDVRAQGQYHLAAPFLKTQKSMNILEIGAAGAMISRLIRANHQHQVNLNVIELGTGWRPYYEAHDIRLLAPAFPCSGEETFHYIHASHWLEHVYSIEETLLQIKDRLRPGGNLFLEVPNCARDYYDMPFSDLPHIHFFSAASLGKALEKVGFKVTSLVEAGPTRKVFLDAAERCKAKDAPLLDFLPEKEMQSILKNIPNKSGMYLRALAKIS